MVLMDKLLPKLKERGSRILIFSQVWVGVGGRKCDRERCKECCVWGQGRAAAATSTCRIGSKYFTHLPSRPPLNR